MALQMWYLKAVQLTQNILEAMLNGLILVMANPSARRVTKKYLVTCACPKCGSQWSFKTTKAGPTDTYKY